MSAMFTEAGRWKRTAALFAALACAGAACAQTPESVAEYDISAFTKVRPELIHFAEKESITPGVKGPHALAADGSGRLLVAGDGEAELFDPEGKRVGGFTIPGKAGCAAFLAGGGILIGVGDHVECFDRDGKPLATWISMGENAVITSVAAVSNLVFLADAGNRVVWRFDADGRMLGQIGSDSEERKHHFVVPSPYFDVVSSPGHLWVGNPGRSRVEEYTAAGTFVGQWGQSGMQIEKFSGCCNPIHLALAPDGAFVTAEKGLPRVKVYGTNGVLECVVVSADQFAPAGMSCKIAASISDIVVDARGRVLVLDAEKSLVRVFVRKP